MWSLFFLFLFSSDGELFTKGQLSISEETRSRGSDLLLSATSCADTSGCAVRLNHRKTDGGKSKSRKPETEKIQGSVRATDGLKRSKRGFTYPGTLWCGAGNIADNYQQLGEFAETDKCCREHDHCPHVIHAFSSKYGFTNFKWHSISHCDCDNVMKQCLRAVNDTSSRVVGQAFFNVIEAPCFEFSLEEQCVERHWYGVCKRYDKVPVAVIEDSAPYDFGGIEVIDVLTIAPPRTHLSEIDEDRNEEILRSESMTESTASGSRNPAPAEPSLTHVVTAAEDFIKVLATVSTSQRSSTHGENTGKTRAPEKKRKKNVGKKKKVPKRRRGKGKGKEREQNTGRVSEVSGSVTGTPSANRAKDVINKNYFVEDSGNFVLVSKNDNFMNSQFSSVRDSAHSNKMMKDEHQRTPDESQVSTSSAATARKESKILKAQKKVKDVEQVFSPMPLTITSKPTTAMPGKRVAKKRQRLPTPTNMMSKHTAVRTTESFRLAGLTTLSPIRLPEEEDQHNARPQHEKGYVSNATAQNTPIVGTKRLRSGQKGGRRNSQKLYSPSSLTDDLPTEERRVLWADTKQELSADPFPQPQSTSQRLQSNRQKSMAEKLTTGVSGEIRRKALKGTVIRQQARPPKSNSFITDDAIKARQEAKVLDTTTSPSSVTTHLGSHAKESDESTDQIFSPGLQTITLSMPPFKTTTSKRTRLRVRHDKSKRKKKATKKLGLMV